MRAAASATGPGTTAKGQLIASNVADLHGDQQRDRNNIQRATALDEKGEDGSGRRQRRACRTSTTS